MNSKQTLLKDIASSKRLMRKELSLLKKYPKLRKSYRSDPTKSSVVALAVEGDTLKVVDFK